MRVLTSAQMARLDRCTIDELGLPGLVLMERAALGVVDAIHRAPRTGPIAVLVGPGNNGGDGSAVARLLHLAGRDVTLVLMAERSRVRGDAATNLAIAERAGVAIVGPDALDATLARCPVRVDALLGIGQTEPPRGLIGKAVEATARHRDHRSFVVSVDVPTGVDADTGRVLGAAIEADVTVTFAQRKFAHVLPPAAGLCGQVIVAPIGVPDAYLLPEHATWFDQRAAQAAWRPLGAEAHKGTRGRVVVVGGGDGTPGASILSARAALTAGAGLVTLVSSGDACRAAIAQEPALMVRERAAIDDDILAGAAVVLVGPGLGLGADDAAIARRVTALASTIVLDADALTLAGRGELDVPAGAILTPHPGELARLLGRPIATVLGDLPRAAVDAADRYEATVIAKTSGALVASAGQLRVVGESAAILGTAGSGDVLAGLVAALRARHDAFDAASLGAWLHAEVGRTLAARSGAVGATASDIRAAIPSAFAALQATP